MCAADQTIVLIDPAHRTITGKIGVGGKIASTTLTDDGNWLAVAVSQPAAVIFIDTRSDKIVRRRCRLACRPPSSEQIAVLLEPTAQSANSSRLVRINIADGKLIGVSLVGTGLLSALDYRKDGETIFVAAPDARQIISLTRLPGRFSRGCLCRFALHDSARMNRGQVFVTGADSEAQLVIFKPYQNEIDQTLYAGHALFGMAVAPVRRYLFLSNPDAGDVTILDIETRRILASVRTGGNPREILVAPSPDSTTPEEYAFVVDGETGDVSVIHIPVVLHKSGDAFIAEPPKPIFAVFHGGARPQSAVIIPYSA